MKDQQYTRAETGMIWGMMIGASIFLIMVSITGDALWILAMGTGITLGYGIGATMEKPGH